MRVRLTDVQSEDQAEFADLIGKEGRLETTVEGLTFFPDGRGDWLSMGVLKKDWKGSKIVVETTLANTFTFQVLETSQVGKSV